ncbi:hypothetical protein BH11MYX1_BH11MYX1_42220 [soil metagenome]
MDFLHALIDPEFMPHGHCYFWRPEMVWLQVVSNLVIGVSYTSISLTLFWLTRRIRGVPFHRAYLAFGAFIVLCGFTHFMDIVTVWRGVYWLDGGVRALTAIASAAVALWLFPLFPRVVGFGRVLVEERELSRARLAASERKFREVVENLPDLAWTARIDGHIDFYNQRWYEYTGTTPSEMEGWGWRSVHDPDAVDQVEARWQEALTTGTPFEMEFRLRGKDARFRWFLTRVRPLRDEAGRIERWIGTNTDIDAQRRIQAELTRSLLMRDEFLSIASHELRTPLQSLLIQLETTQLLLDRGADPDGLRKKLGNATKQVDRLTSLIDSMLDVSRVALDRMVVEPSEVDAVELVRDVIDRLQASATKAGATIKLVAPVAVTGRWDRSRLDQIVTNVLANAIKYGNGSPILVTVAVRGDTLELSVEDGGMGIAEADQTRIFQRFERAASLSHGGLGLGLYISREIARAHGGDIGVKSEPGRGSRFLVSLPLTSTK